jgi:hypothetical protein
VTNDRSKDLNRTDEVDPESEVSDEMIEAASMARGGLPTLLYGTYCFACPSRPAMGPPSYSVSPSLIGTIFPGDYLPGRSTLNPDSKKT